MILQIFNNPGVGDVILRAAQGISQMFQQRAALDQRARIQEENFRLKEENLRAERDAAAQRAERAERTLKVQERQATTAEQREERLTTQFTAGERDRALETRILEARLEGMETRNRLLAQGKGDRERSLALRQELRREAHANLWTAPGTAPQVAEQLTDLLGAQKIPGSTTALTQDDVAIIQRDFASTLDPRQAQSRVRQAQTALSRFVTENQFFFESRPDMKEQRIALEKELLRAKVAENWITRHGNTLTNGEAAQIVGLSVEDQEALEDQDALDAVGVQVFEGTPIKPPIQKALLSDLAQNITTTTTNQLRPLVQDADGNIDNQKLIPFLNWISMNFGDEAARPLRLKIVRELKGQ